MWNEEELVNQIMGDLEQGDGDALVYDDATKTLRRRSEVGKKDGTTEAVAEDFDLSVTPGRSVT